MSTDEPPSSGIPHPDFGMSSPQPQEPMLPPTNQGQPRNGLGVAALVVGIISLPGILTIIIGIVLGALGVIFGAVGWRRARRGHATNGRMALAGAITGAIGLVVTIVLIAVGLAHGSFYVYTK